MKTRLCHQCKTEYSLKPSKSCIPLHICQKCAINNLAASEDVESFTEPGGYMQNLSLSVLADIFIPCENIFMPEHRLMEAIIERAVRDALGVESLSQHDKDCAKDWLWSNSKLEWTFLFLCDELKISYKFVNKVRSLFPGWPEQRQAQRHSDFLKTPEFGDADPALARIPASLYTLPQPALRRRGRLRRIPSLV